MSETEHDEVEIPDVPEGEWVLPRHDGYLMTCCDCGLTHRLEFLALGQVRMRAFVDHEATAAERARKAKEDG